MDGIEVLSSQFSRGVYRAMNYQNEAK